MELIPPGARVFDVTLPVSPELPVWPGDPSVSVAPVARIATGDAANVSALALSGHTGTHVDAPWHFVEDGAKLDEIPPERWVGPCLVVRMPEEVRRIGPEHLETAEIPAGTERLLLRTANSARWRPGKLEFDADYPALSPAGARWVVEHGIRLVGIDALSIGVFGDDGDEAHRTLLGRGVLVIEGLNLATIEPGAYGLLCLPLRLVVGDGAPARVLLVQAVDDREGG